MLKIIPELEGYDRVRFWRSMTKPNLKECWLWQRTIGSKGYGEVWIRGTLFRTHRVAFKLYYGLDPEVCRHLPTCKRHCCNPLHLKDGSYWDNQSDPWSKYIYKGSVIVGERAING